MIHLGCAGWSLSREYADEFVQSGSHLQRYAARLNAVEINSSFYRPHRPGTYARWASSVPEDFRFAVKLPKIITHDLRLQGCTEVLDEFLGQCGQLGSRLGCLLVQLPPSLRYDVGSAGRFFEALRERYSGSIALEPRHSSWQLAQPLLIDLQIAQVAASPSRFETDARPGGWPGLVYCGAFMVNRGSTTANIPRPTCKAWPNSCSVAVQPGYPLGAFSTTPRRVRH